MKAIAIVVLLCLAAWSAGRLSGDLTAARELAATPAPPAPPESAEVARTLTELIRRGTGTVLDYSHDRRRFAIFDDAAWRERLATAVAGGRYESRPYCFCVSYPQIQIVQQNAVILAVSIHHGEYLRAFSPKFNGNFYVGPELGTVLRALALEKPPLVQKPARTVPPEKIPLTF